MSQATWGARQGVLSAPSSSPRSARCTSPRPKDEVDAFLTQAPKPNPKRLLVTGVICGVRIEDLDDPVTRDVRVLDKLVDELAKGRPLEKVLREAA